MFWNTLPNWEESPAGQHSVLLCLRFCVFSRKDRRKISWDFDLNLPLWKISIEKLNHTLERINSFSLTKLTLKIYVFPGNISSRLVHAKLPKSELKKWGDVQIDRRWVSQSVQSRIVRTEQVINQSDFSTFPKKQNLLGIELVAVRKLGSQQEIQ